MKKVSIRKDGSKRVQTMFDPKTEPSKTDQSFAKDCDINLIVKKLSPLDHRTLQENVQRAAMGIMEVDLTQVTDLQGALEAVNNAQEAFNTLPAELRKRFDNDPSKIFDFLQDPKNQEEAVRLGLMEVREATHTERIRHNISSPKPKDSGANKAEGRVSDAASDKNDKK